MILDLIIVSGIAFLVGYCVGIWFATNEIYRKTR